MERNHLSDRVRRSAVLRTVCRLTLAIVAANALVTWAANVLFFYSYPTK